MLLFPTTQDNFLTKRSKEKITRSIPNKRPHPPSSSYESEPISKSIHGNHVDSSIQEENSFRQLRRRREFLRRIEWEGSINRARAVHFDSGCCIEIMCQLSKCIICCESKIFLFCQFSGDVSAVMP